MQCNNLLERLSRRWHSTISLAIRALAVNWTITARLQIKTVFLEEDIACKLNVFPFALNVW